VGWLRIAGRAADPGRPEYCFAGAEANMRCWEIAGSQLSMISTLALRTADVIVRVALHGDGAAMSQAAPICIRPGFHHVAPKCG